MLTSPSATRVFRASDSSGKAQVVQSFVVESGGRLDVFPEILIPHAGRAIRRPRELTFSPGGELFLTEMIAPGRTASGESFLYDRLEFSLDLVRGKSTCGPRTVSSDTQEPRAFKPSQGDFPNAYYASTFWFRHVPADDSSSTRDKHPEYVACSCRCQSPRKNCLCDQAGRRG